MTRANSEQLKNVPWFAKAGAACSIIPIARFVSENIFALKGGGYGCFFRLSGVDEEGLTDRELESQLRMIEGSLRGLPEGAALYQYTRVRAGFPLPRQESYKNPVTQVFVEERLQFLEASAGFRRIDLHWCLTIEPSQVKAFEKKPQENAAQTSRMLADLQKTATLLAGNLSGSVGLELLGKQGVFRFLSYLFNLEDWADTGTPRGDTGIDRQVVQSPVSWESDHLRIGKRFVQMYSLTTTPEASRPCLFSDFLTLDCNSILCSTWRPKSSATARKEIDQQEKFISFFKVGVLSRVMAGKDTASLDTGASAKAANNAVDDLSEVIRSLDKKAQGEFSLRLLIAARSQAELHAIAPAVHRVFVEARAQIMEETLGNLSAFYAMFPGNAKFNVFPMWLGEDHHARLSSIYAPSLGHTHSEDLDSEYLNVFETRTRTPFFQDVYVDGVRVMLILGPTGSGKSALMFQVLRQVQSRGDAAIVYDPAREFVRRFYDPSRGDVILNPLDKRCPYWGPADELRSRSEAKALAASLFQPPQDKKGEFFIESPQKIFAFLMAYGPTPDELVEWMSNPEEIDRRLKGTEHAHLIDPRAHQQRAGVLASLGLVADSLRLLPKESDGNGSWTATEWAEKRQGWVFLTSLPAEREALRPLQSLWIDWLVLRLLNEPTQAQRRVWFVIDELASLQKLPQLHTAIVEARKSRNPLVLGFQGKAQLEYLYGHLAEVMLSQPATSVWLTTKEPKAGQWVSEFIGKVEVERLRETHFDGTRAGRNFQLDRQVEPLVLESEISGLADLHAFMKYQNYVTRFSFPYFDMPVKANGFEARDRPEDRLPYQPKRPMNAPEEPVELKREPEPSTPVTTDGISEAESIEPEQLLFPADDTQNLITHG